jgi:hypothetical protein
LTYLSTTAKKQLNLFKEVIMRTIKISEQVWQAIAERGKFGETEDDVLSRVFDLPLSSGICGSGAKAQQSSPVSSLISYTRRKSQATQRMTSYIARNELHIEFQDGTSSSWTLPDPKDKSGIREVLDKAIGFARTHGASLGQVNAARKTLTDQGYHLTK